MINKYDVDVLIKTFILYLHYMYIALVKFQYQYSCIEWLLLLHLIEFTLNSAHALGVLIHIET